jgi:hypothetical protein
MQRPGEKQDYALDIEDYSGRNFDVDVLDTIVETSHHEPPTVSSNDDGILDEEHWAKDSFDELEIDQEF